MIISTIYEVQSSTSLIVIGSVLGLSVVASLIFKQKNPELPIS